MQKSTTVRLRAFAKINLGLRIVGRAPDGYHQIRSLMQVIDLADSLCLVFEPNRHISATCVRCGAAGVPAGRQSRDNLVARALCLVGAPYGARVHLKKRIPVGAGLGGGSADAAAALAAAARHFWDRLPEDCVQVTTLGRSLGADVPFFLRGGAQMATGVGECLQPLPPLGEYWVVLLHPAIRLDTGEVYRAFAAQNERSPPRPDPREAAAAAREGDVRAVLAAAANDLEAAALHLRPELRPLREVFARVAERPVRMSGSGSSFYTLFRDAGRARYALRRLSGDHRVGREVEMSLARFRPGRGWVMEREEKRRDADGCG